MLTTYLYTFGSVFVVSLISLVGIFTLSIKEEVLRKYIFVFISIAIGALLGDAFIHIIPESFAESSNLPLTSILIIAGIIFFFILEKFLHWHHHGEDAEENHIHPTGKLVLFSDGIHNFMDGIIIGASFLVSIPIGMATTFAVIMHEIPQEIGDFAVLLHSGYSKTQALWANFLSALTSIFGAILVLALGDWAEIPLSWLMPMAAGGFIYIALADLIPELHKTKKTQQSAVQILAILIGIGAMLALTYLE